MLAFKYIIIPFIVVIFSQFIKFLIEAILNKKIDISRFFNGMGGMPSSHSALVSSVCTLTFLDSNGNFSLFGVTFIFSLIVIYDAMGVRFQCGLHAKEINKISNSSLTESIGHKPIEVIGGIVIGIITTLLINSIIK